MSKLPPAAQAVLDAMYEVNMDFGDENATLAAAALRAVADQVVPEEADNENLDRDSWLQWSRRLPIRFELLAIATELEGPNG
jgi:hypothetical protein